MIINDDYLTRILETAHNHPFSRPDAPFDFYPSATSAIDKDGQHHGNCIRAEYYKKVGADKPPIELGGMMIMDAGTALGEMLAKYFINCNVAVNPNGTEGELRVNFNRVTAAGNAYRVSGRIDVVCLGPNGEYIGYEFKTVWSSGKAGRVIKDWRGSFEPDIKNVFQTALYAWYSREHLGIFDWRLTYLHIEGKIGRTYMITVDRDGKIFVDGMEIAPTIHDVFAQYDVLADSIATNTPPPREGRVFMTDEEVVAASLERQLTKKQTETFEAGKKVLVPWSPCTYCDFIATCYDKETAAAVLEARK